MARVVVVSGPPGAGKSTVAAMLAETGLRELGVHLHTDAFYTCIRKGYVEPWLPEAQHQNIAVMQASAAATRAYALMGYDVYVDGIIGPWYLDPWSQLSEEGQFDVRLVFLRPPVEVTIDRALQRTGTGALRNEPTIRMMWGFFADLGFLERCAFNTEGMDAGETVVRLQAALDAGDFRPSP